jgi:hypothetical protein
MMVLMGDGGLRDGLDGMMEATVMIFQVGDGGAYIFYLR